MDDNFESAETKAGKIKIKGFVQQILRGVTTKMEARPFFFLNSKGTLSQEWHKIIFGRLSELN
jgi:hypothetical protein